MPKTLGQGAGRGALRRSLPHEINEKKGGVANCSRRHRLLSNEFFREARGQVFEPLALNSSLVNRRRWVMLWKSHRLKRQGQRFSVHFEYFATKTRAWRKTLTLHGANYVRKVQEL